MFIVKGHRGPHGEVLVISDAEIIGRKYEEGNLQLDLSKEFYRGERKSEDELLQMIDRFYILHLTGPKTVSLFVRLKLVDPAKVLSVKGIPHAQVYMIEK